jgi:N-acetylglucosaminyl-diphospho-decaprenol L-rhamnosyltransferase
MDPGIEFQNQTDSIDLSVVIVNYNGGALVEDCVSSVYENPGSRRFEVIVVDNGSSDGSADRIAARFPEVRLIRRSTNAGLAKAFNEGVALMRGAFLLSLDDGTSVRPGAADALMRFLDAHPDVGAAGARLYDPDMTLQPVARSFPHPLNAIFGRRSLAAKLFPNHPLVRRYLRPEHANSTEPFEVDWNSSAALMVRRAAVETVGAMDPRYFVYWVDADWCFRLRKAGWRVFCVPAAQVVHLENLRTGHRRRPRGKMVLDFHAGAYRFYRTHMARAWWSPMGLLSAIGLFGRAGLIIGVNEIRGLAAKFVSHLSGPSHKMRPAPGRSGE